MKFVLFFVNFALAIMGIVIVVIGIAHKLNTNFISDLKSQAFLENTIIGIGSLIFASAVLGILGALIRIKHFFWIFGFIMFVNHWSQYVLTALTLIEAMKMREYIQGPFTNKFKHYDENPSMKKEVDKIQSHWNCCGFTNVTHFGPKYPKSCCTQKDTKNNECRQNFVRFHKEDCKKSATLTLQSSMEAIGTMAVVITVIDFFVAMWALCSALNARFAKVMVHYTNYTT